MKAQTIHVLDKNKISIRAFILLQNLLTEFPRLKTILLESNHIDEVHNKLIQWVNEVMNDDSHGRKYFNGEIKGSEALNKLSWNEMAGIRILDYIKHAGRKVEDANLKNARTVIQPFNILWKAAKHGIGGANMDFFIDMQALFRQFGGSMPQKMPDRGMVEQWMERHPAGSDEEIVKIREANKERILRIIIRKLSEGKWKSQKYVFPIDASIEERMVLARTWWNDWNFHLKFAIRDPETLNEFLDHSLMPDTIEVLYKAEEACIPFFVNPYYLSLINLREYENFPGADKSIRDYVFYSQSLIDSFGKIKAWEKEDRVESGKPNAAGWLLPDGHNIHRRYPEVAILIPDTMGRACGGLCVSCQRMYDFQSGRLNFDLEKLKPNERWDEKLQRLMQYFENDSQLRDILITGGDALMNSDKSLQKILNAVYDMALRKKEANKERADGQKFAEILRVRLGTRMPVYLPQRITPELCAILSEFKAKASKIGIRQFVIQTHFVTAMELTVEAIKGIKQLQESGWLVTNQMVFTTASARRGHAAKLRKVLNDCGIVSYYTFSVKGFMENSRNFATNARAIQESMEEKAIGVIPEEHRSSIKMLADHPEKIGENLNNIRTKLDIPFLATDRNVLNIPGVGKSLTFRTIGISRYGRRILEFEHDGTRNHSPVIKKMETFVAVESKSVRNFLKQMENYGENIEEYQTVFGYSIGETEPRMELFEYPSYNYKITDNFTNLVI